MTAMLGVESALLDHYLLGIAILNPRNTDAYSYLSAKFIPRLSRPAGLFHRCILTFIRSSNLIHSSGVLIVRVELIHKRHCSDANYGYGLYHSFFHFPSRSMLAYAALRGLNFSALKPRGAFCIVDYTNLNLLVELFSC